MNEIHTLEEEEAAIRKLVTQLEGHPASTELSQIETQLRASEIRLLQELKRLHLGDQTQRLQRDGKADLIGKGDGLLKQATRSLAKLSQVHNSRKMRLIKREEILIQRWTKQLRATTDVVQVTQLEHNLRVAELRMRYYLQQASRPHELASHQQLLKRILTQRGINLERQAKDVLANLKPAQNRAQVALIKKDQLAVAKLTKQIKQIKDETSLLKVERELTMAENRLSNQISQSLHLPIL